MKYLLITNHVGANTLYPVNAPLSVYQMDIKHLYLRIGSDTVAQVSDRDIIVTIAKAFNHGDVYQMKSGGYV